MGVFAADAQGAQALLTPSMMPLMLFCGFLIPFSEVKDYFKEFLYLSFFRYAFDALMAYEFRHGTFDYCDPSNPNHYCSLGPYKERRNQVLRKEIYDIQQRSDPSDSLLYLVIYFAVVLVVTYYTFKYKVARAKYG